MLSGLRLLSSAFFRELEVVGRADIPTDRGGIVVSWHPNGLVDPWLILACFPRPVVFGARHGLFRWPGLGWLLRRLGTVPIYRAADAETADPEQRRAANQRSLSALAERVAAGSFTALFPEGVSHDEPHPVELKTGAARLYYLARQLAPAAAPASAPPAIIPVGLHYDEKRLFRSRVLVWFHPPIELPPALDVTPPLDEPDEAARNRARDLTAEIERVLHDVVHATDDWAIHHVLHRTRKLVRAERAARAAAHPGRPGIHEKALGFARVRNAYRALVDTQPARVAELRRRVEAYDADLEALGLDDHELDRAPPLMSPWLVLTLLAQAVLVFLLLPPLLLLGYIVNGPTALGLLALCRVAARQKKDEATIKILVGMIAFPLTWILAGVLAALGNHALRSLFPALPQRPVLAGLVVAALGAIGGAIALRYLRVLRQTWHAIRVRLARRFGRAEIDRLHAERAAIHDELMSISEGLDLPGAVAPDGSIRAD
jgi:1-acyl-sn-glycerol-3-phosphate acyltransferase